MQTFPSSSDSKSSSFSATRSSNRLGTIFKKAYELSTLCANEVCVIYYGPDGELKTWPEEREKVKDIALRYTQDAKKRKKSVNLYEFLDDQKKKKNFKKESTLKKRKKNANQLKYPISDNYSPDQISQLIQSLERSSSMLQERLRFVESQKQKETQTDHQESTPIPLNPDQFSLFLYDHGFYI